MDSLLQDCLDNISELELQRILMPDTKGKTIMIKENTLFNYFESVEDSLVEHSREYFFGEWVGDLYVDD